VPSGIPVGVGCALGTAAATVGFDGDEGCVEHPGTIASAAANTANVSARLIESRLN
jgi:hypothetical protein